MRLEACGMRQKLVFSTARLQNLLNLLRLKQLIFICLLSPGLLTLS